jgi:2,3-dimethylmalate lyase
LPENKKWKKEASVGSATLRGLLSSESVIVAPGCHDALGAKLIARAGFPAVYMSGNATTASLIGSPDLALLGMAEMVNRARQIALSVELPLICDADTGYGGVYNVFRTVREYEAAGVAAIHIEDQVFPKRCAAMSGVSLASRKDAEDRVKVALESRKNRDFLIIARTDARPAVGIEEAWHRGERFAEIGADMIYIEGLQSRQEIEETARRFHGIPLFLNVLEEWPWTLIPTQELGQMGFRIVIFCLSATLLYARTMQEYLEILRADGNTKRLIPRMMTLHDYENLLGMEEMKTMEERMTKP